jgi:hypothetical protein
VSHPVEWVTASPLWEGTPQPPAPAPALLRFASDTFMDDLTTLLDTSPAQLAALRAQPESFRARPIGKDASWQPPAPAALKLYQPIHGHFYLVSAALVCRIPGFPDHTVQPAQQERVSFVLRRVVGSAELAWANDPVNGKGWVAPSAGVLASYEDLLPLAPVNFTVGARRRRLFVGLVPTATRDTYVAGGWVDPYPTTDGHTTVDSRPAEFAARVVNPLAALADGPTPPADAAAFTLLDFADFLSSHLAASLWSAIVGSADPPASNPNDPAFRLYSLLGGQIGTTLTWRTALTTAWAQRDRITGEDPTPTTFPATLAADLRAAALALVPPLPANPRGQHLREVVRAALPQLTGPSTAVEGQPPASVEVPKLARVPALDGEGPPRFVIRCVYRRPCCGPLQPDVLSEPTEPFSFAPFFDFDAPARPIRIPLPIDTSIKDLRKFRKSVSFVISEQLKGQMNQVGALKDVMSGKLESGDSSLQLGMICSLSIPIITICALMVLLIFLSLLNIVFWWMPFFRICFPFPKRAS